MSSQGFVKRRLRRDRPTDSSLAGSRPSPEMLLRALDLSVRRRIEGLQAGDFKSRVSGRGSELLSVRPYVPGDDVRMIDWNVTARTLEPHVKVEIAERSLVTWLVIDASPSMHFGTADRRKGDVAEGVSLAVGHLATRRGNRLGVVTFGETEPRTLPPLQGRRGLLGLLDTLSAADRRDGGGATSLGAGLARVGSVARRSSLVVVVTDLRGPRDWHGPLLDLRSRHDVLIVEVRDPREQRLVDVGDIWMVDPESGRQIRIDTSRPELRERFARAADAERREVSELLACLDVGHAVLSTEGDWLRSLATFLRLRRSSR